MLQFPPRKSILAMVDDIASSLVLSDVLSCEVGQWKTAVIAAQRNKLLEVLCAKPLHGKFFTWIQIIFLTPVSVWSCTCSCVRNSIYIIIVPG